MSQVIQNYEGSSSIHSSAIKHETGELGTSQYTQDNQSNISGVVNAQTAFESNQNNTAMYGESITQEADNIQLMGEDFQNLDNKLAGIIKSNF